MNVRDRGASRDSIHQAKGHSARGRTAFREAAIALLLLSVLPASARPYTHTRTFCVGEPTENTDGTPLDDLGLLRVYCREAGGGAWNAVVDIPASSPSGGQTVCAPAEVTSAGKRLECTATAVSLPGSESGPTTAVFLGMAPDMSRNFDGDAKSDIAVWRSPTGKWYTLPSSGEPPAVAQWGDAAEGDIPVPGDYDGDGKTDVAVWRPSNGTWYAKPSSGAPPVVAQWGEAVAGDVPVPGDYDGDGKTDFAVWRVSTGTWYAQPSSGAPPFVAQWGTGSSGGSILGGGVEDVPVPGDYDGDGKTDFAVWRPSNGKWFVKPSSGAAPLTEQWGNPFGNDIPVPGDYDGDGSTDFAVWRPSNGTWYVKPSSGNPPHLEGWGNPASDDIPVPGDYDGDGVTDLAVWRPSNGTWYVKLSSGAPPFAVQWGDAAAGDVPIGKRSR